MKLLLIGGTKFLGRHLAAAALARGDRLCLFNRGRTASELFPDVQKVIGDRNESGDLERLARAGPWDAVIDTCGYDGSQLRLTADALADQTRRYVFISTISVYRAPFAAADEGAPLLPAAGEPADDDGRPVPLDYGTGKVACEREVRRRFGERAAIVRPGLIVGPYDPSDRYTYWVRRLQRPGPVLVPGDGSRLVQFIDVRDLADLVLRLAAGVGAGIWNATGAPARLDDVLAGTARGAGAAPPDWTWAGETWLTERGVQSWTGLPLWISGQDQSVGCQAAMAAGLRLRPLAETARDTAAWDRTRPSAVPLKAGLDPEVERRLLAELRGI